jgi:hypothetical protein
MDTQTITILTEALRGYTGKGLNHVSYLASDTNEGTFSVFSVAMIQGKRLVESDIIVRIVDAKIVIERDINDKPLVDALLQAGIPRTQIILAYAGEPVPEIAVAS